MVNERTLLICLDDSLKTVTASVAASLNFSLFKETQKCAFAANSETLSSTLAEMFSVSASTASVERCGFMNVIFFSRISSSTGQTVKDQYYSSCAIIKEILDRSLILEFDYDCYAFILMPPVAALDEEEKKNYFSELKFLDNFQMGRDENQTESPFHHLFLFGSENPGLVLTADQQEKLVELFARSLVSPQLGKMVKNYLDIARSSFSLPCNHFFSPGVVMINLAGKSYRQSTYDLVLEVFFEQLSGAGDDYRRLKKQAKKFIAGFFFDSSCLPDLIETEKKQADFNLVDELINLDRVIDIRDVFAGFTDYFQKQTASILIDNHMDLNYLRLVLLYALEQVNQLAGEADAKHSIHRRDKIVGNLDALFRSPIVRSTFFSRFVSLFRRREKNSPLPVGNIIVRTTKKISRKCKSWWRNVFFGSIDEPVQRRLDPHLRTSDALQVMRLKVVRDFFDYAIDLIRDNISELENALNSFKVAGKPNPFSDSTITTASSPFLFNILPMASINESETPLLAQTVFEQFRDRYEDLLRDCYKSINVEFMVRSMLPYEFLQRLKVRFDELYFESLENEILKIQCHALLDSLLDRDVFRQVISKKIIAYSLPFISFSHRSHYHPRIFYSSGHDKLDDTYRGFPDYFFSDRVVDVFSNEGLSVVQLNGPFRVSELNVYSVLDDEEKKVV